MKIVSYLNVSNASALEADSGYVFQRSILLQLTKLGHEVILIGPPNMPNLPSEIQSIKIVFSESKFGVRFGFNWEQLKEKIAPVLSGTDILLVNQSELTIPLSILCYEISGKKIPCVTYFHYLAVWGYEDNEIEFDPSQNIFEIGSTIWQRQVESAQFSDANIIGSEFGKDLFLTCAKQKSLKENFHVIAPPVQTFIAQKTVKKENPVFLYNHRLYSHYGGKCLFQLLEKLAKTYTFKVIVTDPTGRRSALREKLDPSVSEIRSYLSNLDFVEFCHYETQKEYYNALLSVDIGFAPLRKGALWSMSSADLMSAGIPVLAPKKEVFFEVIQDADLLFANEIEFESILTRLITDSDFRHKKGVIAQKNARNLSIENITKKFEDIFFTVQNKYKYEKAH